MTNDGVEIKLPVDNGNQEVERLLREYRPEFGLAIRRLRLRRGDFLVLQYPKFTRIEVLETLQKRLNEVFEKQDLGVKVLLIPDDVSIGPVLRKEE